MTTGLLQSAALTWLVASGFRKESDFFPFKKLEKQSSDPLSCFFQLSGMLIWFATANEYAMPLVSFTLKPWLMREHSFKYSDNSVSSVAEMI
jgi:hypothetical protein